MFNSSTAFLVAGDKNWSAHVHALLVQAGFREARPLSTGGTALSRFQRGPLPFVFLHDALETSRLTRALTLVRAHSDVATRFVPIIVLSENRDANTVLRFIQMGCDDIISMPVTAAQLLDRLKHQTGRAIDYYQTDTYFGPDRRQRVLTGNDAHHERGTGTHFFRHFSISRHAQRGITILSTDVHYPSEQTGTA